MIRPCLSYRPKKKHTGIVKINSPGTVLSKKKELLPQVIIPSEPTVTPIIKLNTGTDIKLSVALPCYHASKIAWLALESLCRQKNIDFQWELLLCEEEHEDMIGDWYLDDYIARLMAVGCCRIVYIHLDRWVLLAKKWQIVGKHISNTSQCFLLQAADCYSGKNRLKKTYNKIVKEGVEWYDFKKGYFYSFISRRVIIYDFDGQTNLCMGMSAKYAHTIPSTSLKVGIDSFLLKHCLKKNPDLVIYHDPQMLYDGLDTHGRNNISVHRERFFDSMPHIFKKTDKTLKAIIPDKEICDKLLSDDIDEKKRTVSVIKNPNDTIIRQIRFSDSVKFFKEKMLKKYHLNEYDNKAEPAIFMGLYGPKDYNELMEHTGECVILWCGSDSMVADRYLSKYDINKPNYHHIAIGGFCSYDLTKLGVKHQLIPISPANADIEPYKLGDSVYMYSSRKNPKFYGEHFLREIKERTGLNFIVAYKDSYSYEELMDVYKQCFLGLRLTQHDGLPNTVIELGLMGRKCIYNGNLPYSIPWDNVDDICENILKEYNNRNTVDIKAIHADMKNYMNIGNDWMDINYYKKPKVSVVMNSYNEKPKYLIEAIESYLNQKDVIVELIVSTVRGDSCIDICKKYPLKLVINEVPGIYSQLNAGMKAATGDWITYASSNDKALDTKLIDEVNMCINNNKEVCYSSFYKCDPTLNVKSTMKFSPYNYETHLKGNFVSDCALFSKRLLDKYLPFEEEYGNFAYHSFWLRVFEGEGDVFVYNDNPTWLYRINNKSRHIKKQSDKSLLALENTQRENMLKAHLLKMAI